MAAVLAAGCSDPTRVTDGNVEVLSDGDAFVVRNRSPSLDLVQVIVEAEIAAVIDLAPCDEWPDPIAAGGQRRVPYAEVIGYGPDAVSAYVYWCWLDGTTVVDGGSFQVPFD